MVVFLDGYLIENPSKNLFKPDFVFHKDEMNSQENIKRYIQGHFLSSDKDLPLVFFTSEHAEIAKNILESEYGLDDLEVREDKNTVISCKHFPYTCGEVPEEHSQYDYGCPCSGQCDCSFSRSYIPFCGDNEYMERYDNCYDDCCSRAKVYKRILIQTSTDV